MIVKGIIFDADGPLYFRDKNTKEAEKALVSLFGIKDYEKFKVTYESLKNKAYVQEISVLEMFTSLFQEFNISLDQIRLNDFIDQFNKLHSQITAVDGAIETLKQLKSQNLVTCVLTDSFYPENEKWNWFRSIGMDKYLDYIVTSFDIKYLKDTKEAFDVCLKKMQLENSNVAFVGHKQYEMDGTDKSGITSIAILPISEINIKADYYLNSIIELPNWVKNINSQL
jgi:FMN phosphatase YigB (HAD superfamily)